jgi:hypothetical protein
MRFQFLCFLLVFTWSLTLPAPGQSTAGQSSTKGSDVPENPQAMKQIPSGVILVKGAWSSASDSLTPVPEGGSVTDGLLNRRVLRNHLSFAEGMGREVQRTASV